MTEYTAKEIKVLAGLDAVRKRPAMYIGDTGKYGLHHLLEELLANAVDEALAGYCTRIEVRIHTDGSASVSDNGRGIPVDIHQKTGKPAMEVVTTTLHAGGKFEKKAYKVSGGLHGVGLSVVNALSQAMAVHVLRDGKIHEQKYSRGKPLAPVKVLGETQSHGTRIQFKPDPEIFSVMEFDYDAVRERIMELAFLNKGLRIILTDERTEKKEEFYHEGGISEFVEYLNKTKHTKLHPVFYADKKADGIECELAFQYTDGYNALLFSFVNDIKTIEGGTHVIGFKSGLTRALNDYLRNSKSLKNDAKISGDDALEGLTAVVSLKVAEPQFEGQTKTKLGNSEIKGLVASIVYDGIKTYLEENPDNAKQISQKVVSSLEAREAAHKARELIRRKNVFETSVLPGKLTDCSEEDPTKTELFLVEGDSAGGSAKSARDRRYQAILPLRGKILNVEKAPVHKVLTSAEVKAIILSLGCGFGDDLDWKKLRYHKIVVMCDADVDGAHIRTLLLTLFYRYFKSLIEKGYLYIAQPPLYRLKKGKQIEYAYSDEELQQKRQATGEADIQRYKGLGEMNPDQLWETTMDPATRTLKQVAIHDAMKADELFSLLMGSEVEPRREFIEAYAMQVKNLDI